MARHIQNPAIGYYLAIFRTLCNACICRNLPCLESWNIQNPSIIVSQRINWNLRISRTLAYLKPDTFTGPNAGCKAHADYFTVLIYITTRITAKCGIFTHLTSTNLHWLSKASTRYYMDTIYRLLFMSTWSKLWLYRILLLPSEKCCITTSFRTLSKI